MNPIPHGMISRCALMLLGFVMTGQAASESLFPATVRPAVRYDNAPGWELGTIFRATTPGKITHVRVFSLTEESGEHQVRIWRNADNTLVAGPITWTYGGDEAWINLDIPDLQISTNQDYTVSVSVTVGGWYPAIGAYFTNAGNNGLNLSYPQAAGVFSDTAGLRPTTSFNNAAYLRDIVFEPDQVGPILKVKGNDLEIANGDAAPRTADGTQFGGAAVNSGSVDHTFVITNTGVSSFDLTGNPKVALTGPQAADFMVVTQPASPVGAGSNTTFTIRFQPLAGGARDAVVSITNSIGATSPYQFSIQGIGLGSGNLILGNTSEGNITGIIDDHFITGNRHLALRNMRVTEIKAKVAQLAGNFKCAIYSDNDGRADRLLQTSLEVINPADGWQTFTLTQPLDLGAGSHYWLVIWSGALGARVYADFGGAAQRGDYPYGNWPDPVNLASGTTPFSYCLYAEGRPLGVTGPEMSLKGRGKPIADDSTNSFAGNGTDFGGADLANGTRETLFTIWNVGQTNLQLSGNPMVVISGAQAGAFSVTAQPATNNVPAGGSVAFTIRFDPSALGLHSATVSIAHADSPANPYDFLIQGTGLGGGAGVLGNDGEGAYARPIGDGQIHGNRFRAPHSMRLTELRAKVLELAGTFKCAVYSDTNGWADRLLRESVAVVNATNGWNTFALTSPLEVTAGDYYWLVIWSDTPGARVQADAFGTSYFDNYAYPDLAGQWPDPIRLLQSSQFLDVTARTYCIYAEGAPLAIAPGPELDLWGNGKLIVSGDRTPSLLDGTDFGSLDVASGSRSQSFMITNTGNASLEFSGSNSVSVTGPAAGDFTVENAVQLTTPIPPGSRATLTIRFNPTARGVRAATISLTSNDGDENPFQFAVQGAGFTTGLETIWPDTKVGRDIDFDGTAYELGTIFQSSAAGKITSLRVYSLATESGDHIARIWRNSDEVIIGGPYTWNYGGVTGWITMDIPDLDIVANTEYTISISTGTSPMRNYPNIAADLGSAGSNGQNLFYPASAGVFTTTPGTRPAQSFNHGNYLRDIVFVAAGVIIDLPDMEVRGNNTVIATGDTTPNSGDGTDFGTAAPGTGSVERTYLIANTGTAPLNLLGTPKVVVTGPQAGEFAVITQPTTPIPPGGTASLTIRFSPAAAGVRNATVSIQNDSNKNPYGFAISGTGALAQLRISSIRADQSTGNIILQWEGGGQQFQVEKSSSLTAPFQPAGPSQTGRVFTDVGVLQTNRQNFYRVRTL